MAGCASSFRRCSGEDVLAVLSACQRYAIVRGTLRQRGPYARRAMPCDERSYAETKRAPLGLDDQLRNSSSSKSLTAATSSSAIGTGDTEVAVRKA